MIRRMDECKKKPVGARIRFEDKIQNLQGLQGSTPSMSIEPTQSANNHQKSLNDNANSSLSNPLLGLSSQDGSVSAIESQV